MKKIEIDMARLAEMYTAGLSQEAIASKLGVSQWLISQRMREAKITIKPKTRHLSRQQYEVNHNALDELTEKSSWVIGWFLSDGWVNSKYNCVGITLAARDEEVLNKIKSVLGYSGPILDGYSTVRGKRFHQKILKISSLPLKQKLISYDILPNKTTKEKFPAVVLESNEVVIRNFIKGVFDGDGSIFLTRTGSAGFSIVGTKELLEEIQRQFIRFVGVSKTKIGLNGKSKKNHCYLRYDGRLQCAKILSWLYMNSQLHLERKHEKYLQLEKANERRRSRRRSRHSTLPPHKML